MKYPSVRLVFDRKKVATKTSKGLVQLELSLERKRKWLSTGIKLYQGQWDDRKRVIKHEDSVQLNQILECQISNINSCIAKMIKSGEPFTLDMLAEGAIAVKDSDSFIDFVRNRIEERGDISEGTKRQHRSLVQSLERYEGISYMSDITQRNILLYDGWLHTQGLEQTTIHGYHRRLKTYIHEAIRFGYIKNDPYMGIRIDKGKSGKRKYLTMSEIEKIRDCRARTSDIEKARDLFLFQCYTGLSFADMSKFNFEEDVEVRDGKYIVFDRRQKTNEDFFIVLMKPAVDILKKYKHNLPLMKNEKYNILLKSVATAAKIQKNLTSHMGRHSFAVFALNCGVRIEVVSKMLGHTNIKTTQIYAKILSKEVEKGFDIIESYIDETSK